VSLGVAGLDAGLQPEVVAQVVKLPGAAKAVMSMTKAQGKVFVASLAQVKGEVTDEIAQKIAAALQHGALEVELPGIGRVKLNELEPNQPMQMKSKGEENSLGSCRNIADHENLGGHTIERHVGKSENWLQNRLKNDPNIPTASTFRNEAAANRTQGRFANRYKNEIEAWLKSGKRDFVRDIDMEEPIGTVLERGHSKATETSRARLVIRRDSSPRGWYVHTSFPVEQM
jgi:Bacterial CdiA-CT RNAse A domain